MRARGCCIYALTRLCLRRHCSFISLSLPHPFTLSLFLPLSPSRPSFPIPIVTHSLSHFYPHTLIHFERLAARQFKNYQRVFFSSLSLSQCVCVCVPIHEFQVCENLSKSVCEFFNVLVVRLFEAVAFFKESESVELKFQVSLFRAFS